MSSDFEGYEQDFAVLSAEITSKISRVPRLPPDEKKQMVANVEKQLEEARELLEQMDLEVREIPPQSRGMYSNRMRSYKQEMGKLETDFKRSRIAYSDEVRNELLGDDGNSSENQRAHLLDNTERLERSSRRLEAGYQIAVETEQIGWISLLLPFFKQFTKINTNCNHDRFYLVEIFSEIRTLRKKISMEEPISSSQHERTEKWSRREGKALFFKVDACVRNRTSCYILDFLLLLCTEQQTEVQKHKGNQYENCESLLINQCTQTL
ncbi:vesicle transport through interaction with t-SNAREs homolog 1A isoform X2 [Peromyscus maniculatus bairdii]|uniref:vesicle transport through interaction with t-SNAREs homolog 1A isoform X2 n=1 Tax=Peromyscus maniculatus bairdii TaxID=230844 RepID=UPI003FCFB715